MFPYKITEFMAYELHQARQQQAEQRRLIQTIQRRKSISPNISHRLGEQLIKWGLKLQGCGPTLPHSVAVGVPAGNLQHKC